ncbi:hypothetical protein ACIBBD_31145 [Streptomyces sp. NPDC051315]|uniref:hypothetical protein n=1 Tax=Streptomyces sp. NPDC051315 TaxID=3365650 RepID=UPI003794E062
MDALARTPVDDDLVTMRGLAGRAIVAISSARRQPRAHHGSGPQRALPSGPSTPHPAVEAAARCLPSDRGVLVGGSWDDSVPLPDSRTSLITGDATVTAGPERVRTEPVSELVCNICHGPARQ